jgi:outer membrane protein assembly factor BamA
VVGGVGGDGGNFFVSCSSRVAALYEYLEIRDVNSFDEASGGTRLSSISWAFRFPIVKVVENTALFDQQIFPPIEDLLPMRECSENVVH